MTASTTLRRFSSAILATLLGFGTLLLAPDPAAAASGIGYVRLAHLSPDTPAVDVYLSSLSGKIAQQVFPAVGYGTVSPYLTVPTGTYAVAMRSQGSPPASPPVLSTHVTVVSRHAYTVAGVGRYADLGLKVIGDDLAAPPHGDAKVRVIQASVRDPLLTISAGGTTIGNNVAFATTTSYRDVPAGTWSLTLAPQPSGSPVVRSVELGSDSVYSVIVLDGASQQLNVVLRPDAVGAVVIPTGGVPTGAGGMAGAGWLPYALACGVAALAGLVAAAVLRRRRFSPTL